MAKDPAFLFYSNDFLAGTYTMTDTQVGKYIRLLCLQHQKGDLTKKDMMNICKTYDKDIFNKFECQNGKYYNVRLREESEKRKSYSESRSKNRKMSKSYEQHMENENENEIEDINENDIKDKKGNHLFENSEYYDLQKFIDKISEDEKYKVFDLEYYYEVAKNWSAGGKMKKNWITTVKNWMLRDHKDKKAKYSKLYINQNGTSTNNSAKGFKLENAIAWLNSDKN